MNKYLQLLLQLESTVIIPDFGAIIIANEKTGDLLFNEYLKFNDGKLVNFIVENSNMDEQEALNFISKYVREINAQLDKGESYDMFQFGSFTKNKDGKIVFVSWDKIKNVGVAAVQSIVEEEEEAQANEETEATEDNKDEEAQDVAEVPTPTAQDIPQPEETGRAEIEEETTAQEETPKKVNTYIPPSPLEEEQKEEEEDQEKKVEAPVQEKPQGIKVATAKKVVVVPPKKEKKKNRLGLIIILILIIGAGTFAALQLENIKSYFNNNQTEVATTEDPTTVKEDTPKFEEEEDIADTTEAAASNMAVMDSLSANTEEELLAEVNESEESTIDDTEEEIIEEATVEEVVSTPEQNTGAYKMICGNFSELANAEKQVAELKAKGYNAEIIGIFGGLHRVSMNSYNSFQEAVDALPAAKEEVSGAYVSHQ
ncbi:SPOR domain-containing protein [Lishizhenia sp.]|uniref:SPOR domain-containing protein n=1 Tax=Lishizhenia sp. TaxID=2497594 RepID=UPI00299E86FC|nr:SPOR domain-containing protein [Lishizhenia sp.]MDX1445597.1 SPOR domain-containing protein [Lishizhenia sp.]